MSTGTPGHPDVRPTRLAPVGFVDAAGVARVAIPDEPVDLKEKLRRLAAEPGDDASRETCLGLWLWERWQPALEPVGYTRDQFVDEVARTRREQGLWVRGERQWAHYATGLAGRLLRRAPDGAAGDPAPDPPPGSGGPLTG